MAVTIAKLSTISTLDNTQFSRGLGKMRTDIGAFSAISLGAFSRVGSMVTDFARRSLSVLPRMVMSSLEAAGALNDMALQMGFSTDKLANLQRVAGLAGIDMAGLETSIGRMNKTLGDALGGNKAAIDAFSDLRINLADFANKKPEEAFFAILDALKQVPGTARQSAAAMALFGRSGGRMLRLVSMGSAGINAEMSNTRRLGLVTRPQHLSSLDQAGDTIDDLKNNLKGFGDQLALRLSPRITSLGQEFLGFSKNVNLAANMAELFTNTLQTGALALAGIIDTFRNENLLNFTTKKGSSDIQGDMYRAIERSNQKAATGITTPSAPAVPMTRKQPRTRTLGWNPSGYGPIEIARRAAMAEDINQRRRNLIGEHERVIGDIRDRAPSPTSLLIGGKGTPAQEQYLREIRDELKELNGKTPRNSGRTPNR